MIKIENKLQSKRIFELDFVRGICMLLLCFQHLWYFFYYYLNGRIWNTEKLSQKFQDFTHIVNHMLYANSFNYITNQIVWYLFFTMSGISFMISRNHLKRAFNLGCFFLVAYAIGLIVRNLQTYPLIFIFGVFLGYAVYIVIFDLIKNFPLIFHYILTIILFILAIYCDVHELNFELNPLHWIGLSQAWNLGSLDSWLFMPTIFFYSAGGVLARTVYKDKTSKLPILNKIIIFKPLLWMGKNSMVIYVLQAIYYPIVFLMLTIFINGGL
ncbi:MAG: DUF1624 domain-containing protein [Christensenellaceae bacterium]|jgi:uncharacterized membrane protein|nr:DUF1624 domain-containing protein [Christensenellaceae bacterium]